MVLDPGAEDLAGTARAATGGLGADVAIVAIGLPSLANDALRLVRHRGRVSLFAGFSKDVQAEIDVNAIHYNELLVTGSFGLDAAAIPAFATAYCQRPPEARFASHPPVRAGRH